MNPVHFVKEPTYNQNLSNSPKDSKTEYGEKKCRKASSSSEILTLVSLILASFYATLPKASLFAFTTKMPSKVSHLKTHSAHRGEKQ